MRLVDLKEIYDRRPFEPFAIHLADGREVLISHPDALSWQGPDSAPHIHVVHSDGHWEVIAFEAIVCLAVAS